MEKLPETDDDSAALKLYLLAELDRNENDEAGNDREVAELVRRFPSSRWTEEALYSGGNMHLLKHDQVPAISNYETLVRLFPKSTYAPSSHWRAAWMSYRLRRYDDAARLMDEQITLYPAGIEAPSALYWRGRLYEDESRDFGQAANYYRALNDNYVNFYYAVMARQRLTVIGAQAGSTPPAAPLASVRPLVVPGTHRNTPRERSPTSSRPDSSPTPPSTSTSDQRSRQAQPPANGERWRRPRSTLPSASTPARSSP